MRERGKQENEEKVAPIESQMTSHMMRPYSKEDEQKREERGRVLGVTQWHKYKLLRLNQDMIRNGEIEVG